MPEKKRERRVKKSFARQDQARRSQIDRILIVCEDGAIAPNYSKALCLDKKLRLLTEVVVCGEECGSAPTSVYNYAKKCIDEDIRTNGEGDTFDRAYCVIDKDNHTDYQPVLKAIKKNLATEV